MPSTLARAKAGEYRLAVESPVHTEDDVVNRHRKTSAIGLVGAVGVVGPIPCGRMVGRERRELVVMVTPDLDVYEAAVLERLPVGP
jgi:hypothetical protein